MSALRVYRRTVEELVVSGLIDRVRDLDDRRVLKLTLTQKGEQVFKDMHEKYDQILYKQFSNLRYEEIEKLEDALHILQRIVEENT